MFDENKTAKQAKLFNFYLVLISILFLIFVEFYEYYTYNLVQKKVEEHSKTLSFLVWNLDRTTSKDYLEIILQNNDYNEVTVLFEDNSIFLNLKDDKLNYFENLLLKSNFIKIYVLLANVEYNNKTIGYLETKWINKNIYFYNYLMFVIILISIILFFYIKLLINKEKLSIINHQLAVEIESKNQALSEVQKLKQQQDGDYFLTSLLLVPLSENYGKNDQVDVQFFVKQKKNFRFRHWEREIGGDICISHVIELKGKKYTVCLNADAMGKSIQGAGGCLVLGSVFEAIIERTKLSSVVNQQFPERWLKNTFLELHKVFESFDGSMMASLFLCLIDNLTGFMYYIFAEHPFPVLYRNKEAIFLDDKFMFYKIGTTISFKNFLSVRTFQLQSNDIVLVGSDGKDDIVIKVDENGENVVNTDESLFLRVVEESNGDLYTIYNKILEKGNLIDDISILKIEYRFNNLDYKIRYIKSILEIIKTKALDDNNQIMYIFETNIKLEDKLLKVYQFLHRKILSLLKKKLYFDIIYLLEYVITIFPEKENFIFYLAFSYYQIGELTKALDYAEALRLRNIKDKKSLFLLAKIYLKMRNKNRLKEISEIILDLYPKEEFSEKLKNQLELIKD